MGEVIKLVRGVVLFALSGVAVLPALLWLDHCRETELPKPTGSFAVGRTTYVWSEQAHSAPMSPQPGTGHELLAWIWYPAAPGQPAQMVDDYLPTPWRKAVERQRGLLIDQFLTRDLSRVITHSIRDAGLSPLQHSYPVIVMRAGLAGLVTGYASLAEDLASHGYVVVGFDAPYRTSVVVFPDGRVIERAPENNADLLSGSAFKDGSTCRGSDCSATRSAVRQPCNSATSIPAARRASMWMELRWEA